MEPSLSRGTVVETHPCFGYTGKMAIGLLLSGRLRWCHCSPPPGFRHAVLLAVPPLAASGHLVLVANHEDGFTELSLRVAVAYLAQVHQADRSPAMELAPGSVDLAPGSVLDLR